MIILDTNVLSEPLRECPDKDVLKWFSTAVDTALTAISVGEILTGLRILPEGRRRDGLAAAIDRMLATYSNLVLPYGGAAARIYAEMQEQRRFAGHPLSVEDGMIAAVCRQNGAKLATRNIKDFQGLRIELINPWESP